MHSRKGIYHVQETRIAVVLLALTLFSIAHAHAQESRASLGGRGTDPEGAFVPNAKVTVTSVETGGR